MLTDQQLDELKNRLRKAVRRAQVSISCSDTPRDRVYYQAQANTLEFVQSVLRDVQSKH